MSTEVFKTTAIKLQSYLLKDGQICNCPYPDMQRVNDIEIRGRYYRQLSCKVHGNFKIRVNPTEYVAQFKDECIKITRKNDQKRT